MKANSTMRKMLSVLLATVMILTVLPMGAVIAFAEEADGNLTIGASDAAGTVYTIYGTADWATVAAASAAGNTFAGMTVKLGKDMAGTAESPLTLATLFTNFSGTFDGNGKSVSYANVTGRAVIAGNVASGQAIIQNVTISHVTFSATANESGVIIGVLSGGTAKATIGNVTVNECIVDATGGSYEKIGGLVGNTASGSELTVNNCSVKATVKASGWQSTLGIGAANGAIYTNTDSTDSVIRLSGQVVVSGSGAQRFAAFLGSRNMSSQPCELTRIQVEGFTLCSNFTLTTDNNNDIKNVGALIGYVATAAKGAITVKDCRIKNADIKGGEAVGGAIGYLEGNTDVDVTVDGLTVQNTIFTGTRKSVYGVGSVLGRVKDCKTLTVKNILLNDITVTASDTNDDQKYIGGVIGVLFSGNACTVDGVTTLGALKVTGTLHWGGYGGVVGQYEPSASDASLTLKHLNMTHLDMDVSFGKGLPNDNTATGNISREWMGVGGVVGFYKAKGASALHITDAKLDGTVDTAKCGTGAGATAGVIGYVTEQEAYAYKAYDKYAGTITIARLEMLIDITSTVTANGAGTAALIGNYGQNVKGDGSRMPDLKAKDAVLTVKDVYIGGDVTGSTYRGVGGIMGWASFASSTVTVDRVIFAGTLTNTTEAGREGLLVGRGLRLGMNVTMKNCSSVSDNAVLGGDLGEQNGWIYDTESTSYQMTGATLTLNGITYTAVTTLEINAQNAETKQFRNLFNLQRDSVITVTAAEAASMVNRDSASGWITSVDGHLVGNLEQHTASYEKNGKQVYDIRFITLVHAEAAEGYSVTIRAKTTEIDDDNDILFANLACDSYVTLLGYEGLVRYEYTPAQLNGKSFIAVVLTGIPAGVAYDFEVTASYTTESGVVMTDTTRTLHVSADGVFGSAPIA